ncbi:hypothetical protein EDD18DRAFT_1382178 [Armillaria luteobubalina]|uniref:Uncharacterized protein n=1 Tax=Armillaria luteobubalina TaxID=153913 RepID=A0AA39QAD4_9AGAR|nr:hypothetical protein EDD18DRAFT_1382178 [Armillaria luteobubalina]
MLTLQISPRLDLAENPQHGLITHQGSPISATVSFPDRRDFEIFLDNYSNALSEDSRPGMQLMRDESYDALVSRLLSKTVRGNLYSRTSLADKFFSLTVDHPPRLTYKDQTVLRQSEIFSILQEHHCPSSRRMYANLRKTYCFIPRQVVNEYVKYCSLGCTELSERKLLRSTTFLRDNNIASQSTCPHPSPPPQVAAPVSTAVQSEAEYRSTAPTPSPTRFSQSFDLLTPGITLRSPSATFSSIMRSRRHCLTPSPSRQNKFSSISEPQNECSRSDYSYGIVRGSELFIPESLSDRKIKDDALPIQPSAISCGTMSSSSSLSPAPKTPQPDFLPDDVPSPAFSDLSFIFASPRSPLASKTLPVPYSNEHDDDDSNGNLELGTSLDVYGGCETFAISPQAR